MVKRELKETKKILFQVKRGERPKPSVARRVLIREKVIDFKKTGKKFGEGKFFLTPKGKRFIKGFKIIGRI